jgi:hypothetical protein
LYVAGDWVGPHCTLSQASIASSAAAATAAADRFADLVSSPRLEEGQPA